MMARISFTVSMTRVPREEKNELFGDIIMMVYCMWTFLYYEKHFLFLRVL